MSLDVTCPHCNEEFDVHDHHESGSYECPMCRREIWIEVDYSVSYEATCMDENHNFQPSEKYIGYDICTNCGGSVFRPSKEDKTK